MPCLEGFTDPDQINEFLLAQSGDIVFDIGANGGFLANHLAKTFRHVHAFEPCSESFVELKTHAAPNVECHDLAVSCVTGEVTLRVTDSTTARGELVTGDSLNWGNSHGARAVASITLDDAAEDFGLPDLIKIDTEGHEVEVLRGGPVVLSCGPVLVVEFHAEINGPLVNELTPGYVWECVRHDGYRPGTYEWKNHFYGIGRPK